VFFFALKKKKVSLIFSRCVQVSSGFYWVLVGEKKKSTGNLGFQLSFSIGTGRTHPVSKCAFHFFFCFLVLISISLILEIYIACDAGLDYLF